MNEQIDTNPEQLWERAMKIYLSTLQSPAEREQVERYLSMITNVTGSSSHIVILTSNAGAADFLKSEYYSKFK